MPSRPSSAASRTASPTRPSWSRSPTRSRTSVSETASRRRRARRSRSWLIPARGTSSAGSPSTPASPSPSPRRWPCWGSAARHSAPWRGGGAAARRERIQPLAASHALRSRKRLTNESAAAGTPAAARTPAPPTSPTPPGRRPWPRRAGPAVPEGQSGDEQRHREADAPQAAGADHHLPAHPLRQPGQSAAAPTPS